jgi:hypothetical protein
MRMGMGRKMVLCFPLAAALILLSRVFGGAGPEREPPSAAPRTEGRAVASLIAGQLSASGFDPSLEAKEAVDFLLTPALLVQDALSDDVILTYPTE